MGSGAPGNDAGVRCRNGTLRRPRPVCPRAPRDGRAGATPQKNHGRRGLPGRPWHRVPGSGRGCRLLEMIRDELGHLEHRHLLLAAEHRAQLLVGVDEAPIDGVLQLVLLDVVPDLLGDIGAGHRHRADNGGEHADGVIGFMNAAFGLRFAADFFAAGFFAGAFFAGAFLAGAFFAAGFFAGAFFAAGFFADFFAAFLAVAIVLLPLSRCSTHCAEHSEADRPVTVNSCSIGGNYSAIPREGNPSPAVFSQCCARRVARLARRDSFRGARPGRDGNP